MILKDLSIWKDKWELHWLIWDDCRDKYTKVVENITFLKGLVDKEKIDIDYYETNLSEKCKELLKLEDEVSNMKKELKDARDQIGNGLSLKGEKEIRESILQFQNYGKIDECSKDNEGKDKGLKNATEDKKTSHLIRISKSPWWNRDLLLFLLGIYLLKEIVFHAIR